MDSYTIRCGCQAVRFELSGEPIVRGVCHCEDCRELLGIPYHTVTAWKKEHVKITDGHDAVEAWQHPTLTMQKHFCRHCGDTLFNSNAKDWRVVSQLLIRRNYDGTVPEALRPKSHFFYASRIVDIDDDLPKRD